MTDNKQTFATRQIQAHRHQDIVEDIFDLGLLAFAVVWAITEKHFSQETLATVAIAGAGFRVLGRRVFKAILGPRILKAVDPGFSVSQITDDGTEEDDPPTKTDR